MTVPTYDALVKRLEIVNRQNDIMHEALEEIRAIVDREDAPMIADLALIHCEECEL